MKKKVFFILLNIIFRISHIEKVNSNGYVEQLSS